MAAQKIVAVVGCSHMTRAHKGALALVGWCRGWGEEQDGNWASAGGGVECRKGAVIFGSGSASILLPGLDPLWSA